MNGPAHYTKAEEILVQLEGSRDWDAGVAQVLALRAVAHATLANAAATALASSAPAETRAWLEVARTRVGEPD